MQWYTCVNTSHDAVRKKAATIVEPLGEKWSWRDARDWRILLGHERYTSRSGDTCVHATPINNDSRLLSRFSPPACFPHFLAFIPKVPNLFAPKSENSLNYI